MLYLMSLISNLDYPSYYKDNNEKENFSLLDGEKITVTFEKKIDYLLELISGFFARIVLK